MSSCAMTHLHADYTIIHLWRNLLGVADLFSSADKIREMERILQKEGIEERAMTWEQLGYEVGLECTGQTVKNAMGSLNYRKSIACKKGWVIEKTARYRKAWAQTMKEKYPKPEDWYRVKT